MEKSANDMIRRSLTRLPEPEATVGTCCPLPHAVDVAWQRALHQVVTQWPDLTLTRQYLVRPAPTPAVIKYNVNAIIDRL